MTRRAMLGLAALLGMAGGCHVIGGYDALSLRDNASLAWAVRLRGDDDVSVRTIFATPAGEVVVAGTYEGALELGESTLPDDGGSAFVTLVDASGGYVMHTALDASSPLDTLRASGRFLAGTFDGTLTRDGVPVASAPGSTALFLMEINSSSNPSPTVRALGGSGFALPDDALALAVDSAGEVILGGGYSGSLELDGCAPYPSRTKSNVFLAKLAADGSCRWAFQNVDDAPQRLTSIAVDGLNDYVVVGGEFVGQLRFGNTASLQNSGGTDLFIARLDGDGRAQWSHAFGNGLTQGGARVAAAPGGFSALVAFFDGTLDFGAGALTASRGHDIVVANFRPSGQLEWQRHLTVTREACASTRCVLDELAAAFDVEGNLVVGGPFRGALDIEGVTLAADEAFASYFLVKFDRSGNLLWSGHFGDDADDCAERGACEFSLALDAGRDILVGGSFAGALDFNAVDHGQLWREQEPREPDGPLPRGGFLAKFLR